MHTVPARNRHLYEQRHAARTGQAHLPAAGRRPRLPGSLLRGLLRPAGRPRPPRRGGVPWPGQSSTSSTSSPGGRWLPSFSRTAAHAHEPLVSAAPSSKSSGTRTTAYVQLHMLACGRCGGAPCSGPAKAPPAPPPARAAGGSPPQPHRRAHKLLVSAALSFYALKRILRHATALARLRLLRPRPRPPPVHAAGGCHPEAAPLHTPLLCNGALGAIKLPKGFGGQCKLTAWRSMGRAPGLAAWR